MPSIPFLEPSEPQEFERTTVGRKSCPSCGEWVYPFAFPPECDICGEPLPEDE